MFGLKKPVVPAHPLGQRDLKELARRLQHLLPIPESDAPLHLTLEQCQDIIARMHHHASWSDLERKGKSHIVDALAPNLLNARTLADLPVTSYLPLGHDRSSLSKKSKIKPVWAQSVGQALDQTLVVGSTGAGKTEILVSMAGASMSQGRGIVYMDGKGDSSVWAKMFSHAQATGRVNDLLAINFMTGSRDTSDSRMKLSNTFNPFEKDNVADLLKWLQTWLTVDLVVPASLPVALWEQRMDELLSAVLGILVWGRDERLWALDLARFGAALDFSGILLLLNDARVPLALRQPLQLYADAYLSKPDHALMDQPEVARVRYATLGQQMADRCLMFARAYSYIFEAQVDVKNGGWMGSEIDMDDVLNGRKILVVLLPALEKSIEELGLLGQAILGAVQVAIERRAAERTSAADDVNTVMIGDDAGYYMGPGVGSLTHHAPMAGVACVWGAQDIPSLKRRWPDLATQLADHCGTKIFMKMEDPDDTFTFYQRAAFRGKEGAHPDSTARAAVLDLKGQRPGDAIAVSNGHSIPLKMMYLNPPRPERVWLNSPALKYLGQVDERASSSFPAHQ